MELNKKKLKKDTLFILNKELRVAKQHSVTHKNNLSIMGSSFDTQQLEYWKKRVKMLSEDIKLIETISIK